MKCPHCNQEHPDGFQFCPTTGQKINVLKACSNKNCPDYGKFILPLDSMFCPRCGSKLDGGDIMAGDVKTFTIKGVSFKMIKVKAGAFLMGDGYKDSYENTPIHEVKITKDYYISETLVTRKLFNAVMPFHNHNWKNEAQNLDCPATGVTWTEAKSFTQCLNKILKRDFDLPTEAEWEYAAIGGEQSNGFIYSGSDNLAKVAWTYSEMKGKLQKVGQKQPNELGIYDMSGLALEWCLDWYEDYSCGNKLVDPQGPNTGKYKVVRGGYFACFKAEEPQYRICTRTGFDPHHEGEELNLTLPVSFRIVMREL